MVRHVFGMMDIVFSRMLNNPVISVITEILKLYKFYFIEKAPFAHSGKSYLASSKGFYCAAFTATDGQLLTDGLCLMSNSLSCSPERNASRKKYI